jgi:carbonic anhydrase
MNRLSRRDPKRYIEDGVMDRRQFVGSLVGLGACPFCAVSARAAGGGAHWTYEGVAGPAGWGRLSGTYRACAIGIRQSPLDIVDPIRAVMPALAIAYRSEIDDLVNNGHTIQANMPKGSTLSAGTEHYDLVQFHFHHPSEHLIGGKGSAMECHFVHSDAAGRLGVLGVMISEGAPNAASTRIVEAMPAKKGAAASRPSGIDLNGLLPVSRDYYRYSGSLTTPPCSEDVDWMLLADPITVAADDIAKFAALYPMNARPAQKGFRRFVLKSSSG